MKFLHFANFLIFFSLTLEISEYLINFSFLDTIRGELFYINKAVMVKITKTELKLATEELFSTYEFVIS